MIILRVKKNQCFRIFFHGPTFFKKSEFFFALYTPKHSFPFALYISYEYPAKTNLHRQTNFLGKKQMPSEKQLKKNIRRSDFFFVKKKWNFATKNTPRMPLGAPPPRVSLFTRLCPSLCGHFSLNGYSCSSWDLSWGIMRTHFWSI